MRRRKDNLARKKFIFSTSLIGLIVAVWCCQLMAVPPGLKSKPLNIPELNPKVLQLATTAYHNAKAEGIGEKDLLTIVDYSLPSTEKRLWVIDMRNNKVVHHTHVSHGIGSGGNYATKFSNNHGSKMSSLGLFLTGDIYNGHYGASLNLHGLEDKFNSNALARRIVVHPAHYANEWMIKSAGRLGRSFGCLALNTKIAHKIMHTIKNGSLIFCYYPDKNWLKESKLLRNI